MAFRQVGTAAAISMFALLSVGATPATALGGPWVIADPSARALASGVTGTEPVTLVSLTDSLGERTPVALDGLERLGIDEATGGVTDGAAAQPALWAPIRPLASAVVGLVGAARRTVPVRNPAQSEAVSTDGIAILTPPIATSEFLVAGVTWEAGEVLPPDSHVFIRVLEDSIWSEWLENEPEEAADAGAGMVEGTDPFVTGGAEAFQIQVTGDAAALPPSLRISLIPARPAPAEDVVTESTEEPSTLPTDDPVATVDDASRLTRLAGAPTVTNALYTPQTSVATAVDSAAAARTPSVTLSGSPVAALARPTITSRSGWGADPSLLTWSPTYVATKAAVVHHTAGTNTYTAAQSASIVRSIYYYHAVTRGWGDIGYNFLVDKYGQIFEGRSGSLTAADGVLPVGAHASGFNTGSLGISAMGDYTQVNAPQVILDSMASVIAWRFSGAGIVMGTPSGFVSPGTTYRPAGQSLPRIFAHRDVAATTCPGNDIYSRISSLTSAVTTKLAASPYAGPNAARLPSTTVTASSENTASGQSAVKAVDGSTLGFPTDATKEWATLGGKRGAGSSSRLRRP